MHARGFRPLWAAFIVAVMASGVTPGLPPGGWSTPTAIAGPVEDGQRLYDRGEYEKASTTLQSALDGGGVLGDDVVRARALLGRCYVKAGRAADARAAFLGALERDPAFRLSRRTVPPDEYAVFGEALAAFNAERERRAQRVPASIALFGGIDGASHSALEDFASRHGGNDVERNKEFGFSVRFPIASRWSLDLELLSIGAKTSADTLSFNDYDVETEGAVLAANLYWTWFQRPKTRVYLFTGAGALSGDLGLINKDFSGVRTLASENGVYAQGGAEAEYLLHPRVSLSVRGLGRYALSRKLNFGDFNNSSLDVGGSRVDFRGYAAQLGLRAYIGN